MEEIGPFLDAQKGLLVVSIDEQFSRNLDAGKEALVQLICDGRRSNTTQILAGYVGQIVKTYSDDFNGARSDQTAKHGSRPPQLVQSEHHLPVV